MTDRLDSAEMPDDAPPEHQAGLLRWRDKVGLIADELKRAKVGDVISYDALARASGVNEHRIVLGLAWIARKRVRHEPGYVFRPVDKVGFVRLSDAEIADRSGEESRHRIRRDARRAQEELACVSDFAALTNEQRASWNAGMAISQFVTHALDGKRVQKVLATVSKTEQQSRATEELLKLLGS